MPSPPWLEYAGAADLLGGEVRRRKEDDRDHRLHDADGDAERDLAAADAEVVDIEVQHLDVAHVQRVAEGQELVDARVEEVADVDDQQNKEGGHQQGDGNLGDLLPAVGAAAGGW